MRIYIYIWKKNLSMNGLLFLNKFANSSSLFPNFYQLMYIFSVKK